MAEARGRTFTDASVTSAVATATTKGNTAQTAADAANAELAGIADANSDAQNHAQKTTAWTDTSLGAWDNGAKGYSGLAQTAQTARTAG